MTKKTILIFFLMLPLASNGQKWAVSTNILDYANFLTLNGDISYSVHKNWTVFLSARYNPFVFNSDSSYGKLQNKTATISAGTRYWPFFVYSGFYIGTRVRWSAFNTGGIVSGRTCQGQAAGAGINAGYSLLLTSFMNMEFGIGAWTGWAGYSKYSAPVCGRLLGTESKWFILPDEIKVSLLFTF